MGLKRRYTDFVRARSERFGNICLNGTHRQAQGWVPGTMFGSPSFLPLVRQFLIITATSVTLVKNAFHRYIRDLFIWMRIQLDQGCR